MSQLSEVRRAVSSASGSLLAERYVIINKNNELMPLIFDLHTLAQADESFVGAKASRLAALHRQGLSVPAGFVISSSVFDTVLGESWQNTLQNLDQETMTESRATEISRAALEHITSAPIPAAVLNEIIGAFDRRRFELVAVRSSADSEDGAQVSWAGQFQSYLRVSRDDLVSNVRRCWASALSPRALMYSGRVGLPKRFAVLVQEMVDAEIAGVAFSNDPVTGDENITIEAVAGTGEGVVSGAAVPQRIVVSRSSGHVLAEHLGDDSSSVVAQPHQPNLFVHAGAIRAIRESLFVAEALLGSAADIEWAHDGQRLSILQARPITTTEIPPVVRSFTEEECIVQFRARGIRTLLAEILYAAYLPLGHLFLSDGDHFRQYAPKVSVEQTLGRGTALFSDFAAFESYTAELFQYLDATEASFRRIVGSPLSADTLATSFRMMSGVIERYSRMDFIYTDDAVLLESAEPEIAASLQLLKQSKDAIRERINGLFFGKRSALEQLVSFIATASGQAPSDLHHCRSHELVKIAAGQSAPRPDLDSRRRAYAFLPAHHAPVYLAGDNALQFMRTFSSAHETAHGYELQGVVASRGDGSVVGLVRLINVDYSDPLALEAAIRTMQDGEILVAETTAPELTEACGRARAIVTDLGGRLSHAAIVSRERRIPCIVATQHATDIFRTGDLVEVNVDSARIKRLNPDPVRDAAESQRRSTE